MKRARLLHLGLVSGLWTLTALVGPNSLAAQETGVARGFELERRGKYAEAAEAYRMVLLSHPTEISALLGMERSLLPLGRTGEIIPQVQAALEQDPTLTAVYGVGVRAWGAVGQFDSLESLVERWIRIEPTGEAPYREWGRAAIRQRNRQAARRAYRLGRQRLGTSGVLAADLAELAFLERDYGESARQWVEATLDLPGYKVAAINALAATPPESRADVLQALDQTRSAEASRLAANLDARWGNPERGFELLGRHLPSEPHSEIQAYREFLENMRGLRGDRAKQIRARVLEAIAALVGGPESARLRLDAARAFAEGGDPAGARRMLAGLADDRDVPADLSAGATLTLIKILITEGQLEDAEGRLAQHQVSLGESDRVGLWREVAEAWVAKGDLDRAEAAIAHDESIDGLAFVGLIRLYRGDIRGAIEAFHEAGPFAGSRPEAVGRTSLLALLQPIRQDSIADLGRGFLALAQGDTALAAGSFARVAGQLGPAGGGAELYLLAGRLEWARGNVERAEGYFRQAATEQAPATAPAALLELSRLLVAADRTEQAVSLLEDLILTYPTSALVPQARRLLNQIGGAVPRI